MEKVYIIHENSEWTKPLISELNSLSIPYEEWFTSEGSLDIQSTPPKGIFYNRMSASSHTRDHRFAVEYTDSILLWLERHSRRVINGLAAARMEVRKLEQYLDLERFGIKTPYTIGTVGKKHLLHEANQLTKPFITKPNRGGKGLGVHLFSSGEALEKWLKENEIDSIDGTVLLQEYIKPRDKCIVRMEFIGGKFHYAVRVDTSEGFELCPADVCATEDAFCPADGNNKFEIIDDFEIEEIDKIEAFLAYKGIEIGAVEFVENEKGVRYFYDVNVNTNYNSEAEARKPEIIPGMRVIAEFLQKEWLKSIPLVKTS